MTEKSGFFIRWACVLIIIAFALSACAVRQTQTGINGMVTDEIVFPMQEGASLTYWVPLHANALPIINSFSETEWYKELEKLTGVKVDFIHPVSGQEREQLNVMLASRDLPDIIENTFENYSGGIIKAGSDGLVIDLKDLHKKYAPNLMKLYEMYPELLLDIETDEGAILRVPFIRGHDNLRTFRGLVVRNDWLGDLGLSAPETIDEWYSMLSAFKEIKGATVPFLTSTNELKRDYGFVGAFGINNSYFAENGKIVYGPADPRYKDFLATLNRWYKEGLIYSELALSSNTKVNDALVVNGQVGSMMTILGGGVGKYIELMKDIDPEFDLLATPYPTLQKGEIPKFIHQDPTVYHAGSASVTSSCKTPEIALAWLDYGYSKEGNMIHNFGIEGISYEMVNDYPEYTEIITNNPDGVPMATIGHKYCRAFAQGPFVQDERYLEQYLNLPQQIKAIEVWTKYADEVNKVNTKVYGELNPQESSKITPMQVEITTYVDEMFLKFVLGREPLDKFDEYTSRIRQLGIDEIIKIKQTAYDRFISKFPQAKELKSINAIEFYRR
ncbi:MAG: extracellular solute-binding protein [Firmicutes bacterium]|nr:extracellular solute-binding protein [Bacillota bacterium]